MNKISLALCFTVVIISVFGSEASPVMRTDDQKYVNCVEAMQKKCEKLHVPYEVLIQGPAGSRFVRSLLTEDSIALKATNPKKRSSVSIFKPDENKDNKEVTPEESAPAADADKAKETEVFAGTDVAKKDVKVTEEIKIVDEVKADEMTPKADEKTKREVDNKEDGKSSDSEQAKDEAAEEPKIGESIETPKEAESADKPKDKEATEAASGAEMDNAEKKLKKRDAETSEIQEALDEATKESGADAVNSNGDTKADTDVAPTTEPSVGLALPIVPPILGLLPLQLGALNLDVLKTNMKLGKGVLIDAKLAPLRAKIAAIGAHTKAKLALLPLAKLPLI
ncbi:uncharacterized protein LOC129575047 [Sitodiplosis mosellana]|uniref:uncharacterized protein LOC129575047 n=1 Tax=Sitodiplosis mosellana TaxID=263140 RepID=UPI002443F083|nr:uncharacterized protein LOC129575047 [Sitodiplosis mosellana]